ncbi:MAG: lytic transglycosylase domain-containing protein [Desulfohalobiaceae bacterium]|nr:lytic transglycosylase domain-containing protein [Desulfohalobiaceae bacterium]
MPRKSTYLFEILLFVCFLSLPSQIQAGTIYYFEDKDGVLHFTDMPTADHRPFLTFDPDHHTDREEILALVRESSRRHALDPKLVQAVLAVESNYDPQARSQKGAEGLMQIMPATQKELGLIDPYDPAANIEAGVRYLKMMLDRHQSLELALAAYNAGPGRVEQYQGVPPFPETRRYIKKVLRLYNRSP